MPNKCSAYNFQSGYRGFNIEGNTFHSYPCDLIMCEHWNRANPQMDFKPSKNSKIARCISGKLILLLSILIAIKDKSIQFC